MKNILRWLRVAGMILILLSLGLVLGSRLIETRAQQASAAVASRMEELLAVRTSGTPGVGTGPAMPALELDGRDYAAFLEVPGLGVALPVCDSWEDRTWVGNPCRYWGSCYDGSLIIGGGRMGQMEFCARLDLGDRVTVTDLQGRMFTYTVSSILRAEKLTFRRLREGEKPLTMFARDGSSGRYIIVGCDFLQ